MSDEIEFLRGVDSPTVANAAERLEVQARTEGFLDGRIRCQFPELGTMVGYAVTVTMTNARGLDPDRANFWRMWEVLEAAPDPSVLVIADASGEPGRVAYAGDIMSSVAQRLGAVGMVTDGALRDLTAVRELGFHYFMRFPVVSHADFEVVSVGEPVVLGGQRVVTGDLVHGDENGVVVLPPQAHGRLRGPVEEILAKEDRERAVINAEPFDLSAFRRLQSEGAIRPGDVS